MTCFAGSSCLGHEQYVCTYLISTYYPETGVIIDCIHVAKPQRPYGICCFRISRGFSHAFSQLFWSFFSEQCLSRLQVDYARHRLVQASYGNLISISCKERQRRSQPIVALGYQILGIGDSGPVYGVKSIAILLS